MNKQFLEQSLGDLTEPLLIFSGPCSNLESTTALLELATREGFSPERVICTGDVVAYCADPYETTRVIRDFGCHVLMGNCEESFGNLADTCGCGFEEGSSCDVLSVAWFQHGREQLDEEMTRWMAGLPGRVSFTMGGQRAVVVHGSVDQINEFVFPATDESLKSRQIVEANADLVVGGHSGIPFTQRFDNGVWHNSGIIGIPANEGTPRVWFSTLEPVDQGIVIRHRSLAYDHARAADRIRGTRTLPNDYADCLESGLWPSDDVMPSGDSARRGQPLEESTTIWPSIRRAS